MKKIIFLNIACLCFSSACFAKDTLTETDVLRSVKMNFPLIVAANNAIRVAEGNYLSAKGGFDPKIKSQFIWSPVGVYQNGFLNNELAVPISNTGNNLFTGYRIGRGNFPVYDQGRWTYNYGEVRLGMEIPMLRDRHIDSRRGKIQQAEINVNFSEADLKFQQLQTNLQAEMAYWTWYEEGKKLAIQQSMLNIALNRKNALEKSVSHGDLARIEVVDNDRIIYQRKYALNNQRALFQKASFLLSLYYRDASGNPLVPTVDQLPSRESAIFKNDESRLSSANSRQLIDEANHHPGIQKIELQKQLSYLQSDLASNKLLPALNSRIYVAQDFGGGTPPLNRSSINYELTFELPIFQREARGEIKAAENMLTKMDAEQAFLHEQLIVNIKDALNQINYSSQMIRAANQAVSSAYQVEQAEVVRFKHGDSNLFLVNQREMATAEAKMNVVSAIANYYKAKASLIFSTGRLKL